MQRNGQNPIRKVNVFDQAAGKQNDPVNSPSKNSAVAGICVRCGTAVPPKPGFRPSALKCPKCGTPLGKK